MHRLGQVHPLPFLLRCALCADCLLRWHTCATGLCVVWWVVAWRGVVWLEQRPQLWIHDDYDPKTKKYADDVIINREMFPDLKVCACVYLHCPPYYLLSLCMTRALTPACAWSPYLRSNACS